MLDAPGRPDQRITLGRYDLLARLGRGGMTDAYLAVARGLAGFQKLSILKVLRPHVAQDDESFKMFLDEARLSANFSHPNVAHTHGVEQDGDLHFIVMEYLEGRTLAQLEAEQQDLPLPLQLRALADALHGLHYAHELTDLDGQPYNVVHRDVSPQNVFVTYGGRSKIVDFGIAKARYALAHTRQGTYKGKLRYMAPEQLRGEAVDRRADVFSAGAVLWAALSGRRLWEGLDQVAIIRRLTSREPVPRAGSIREGVPPSLDAACSKALALDPDARFANMAEFAAVLESQLASWGSAGSYRAIARFLDERYAPLRKGFRAAIDERLRALRDAPISVSLACSSGAPSSGSGPAMPPSKPPPSKPSAAPNVPPLYPDANAPWGSRGAPSNQPGAPSSQPGAPSNQPGAPSNQPGAPSKRPNVPASRPAPASALAPASGPAPANRPAPASGPNAPTSWPSAPPSRPGTPTSSPGMPTSSPGTPTSSSGLPASGWSAPPSGPHLPATDARAPQTASERALQVGDQTARVPPLPTTPSGADEEHDPSGFTPSRLFVPSDFPHLPPLTPVPPASAFAPKPPPAPRAPSRTPPPPAKRRSPAPYVLLALCALCAAVAPWWPRLWPRLQAAIPKGTTLSHASAPNASHTATPPSAPRPAATTSGASALSGAPAAARAPAPSGVPAAPTAPASSSATAPSAVPPSDLPTRPRHRRRAP